MSYVQRLMMLAFLGLVISGYTLYHQVEVTRGFQIEQSFCSINSTFDCDAVAKSSYATVAGFPIAALGILYYSLFLLFGLLSSKYISEQKRLPAERLANLLFFLSFLSLPPSIYLLGISKFVLNKFCLMCCALDIDNALLVLVAYRNPTRKRDKFGHDFLASAVDFLQELMPFFSDAKKRSGWRASSIILTIMGGLVFAKYSEPLLIRYYFEPRQAALVDREVLRPAFDAWKASPEEDVLGPKFGNSSEQDFTLGNPKAKVMIVIFSDYQCPFCKLADTHLKPYVEKHAQDVFLVFRNFPLDNACNPLIQKKKHEFACRSAAMARCAGVESEALFWKMHDALVALTEFDESHLMELATQTGVKTDSFESCVANPETMKRVEADVLEGSRLNVNSTPTIFVNRKRLQVPASRLPGLMNMIIDYASKR